MVVLINDTCKLLWMIENGFILSNCSIPPVQFPSLGKKGVEYSSSQQTLSPPVHNQAWKSQTQADRARLILALRRASLPSSCFVSATHCLKLLFRREKAIVKASLSDSKLLFDSNRSLSISMKLKSCNSSKMLTAKVCHYMSHSHTNDPQFPLAHGFNKKMLNAAVVRCHYTNLNILNEIYSLTNHFQTY